MNSSNNVNLQNKKLSGNAFSNKLRRHNLALTSFAAIASPLQDAAMNQDGDSFLNFKVLRKKDLTKMKNDFAEMLNLV